MVFLLFCIANIGSYFLFVGKKSKPDFNYRSPKSPMSDQEFRTYMDSNGRMTGEREFRDSIYQGGVEPSLRKVTWRHLLNVFPPGLYYDNDN